MANATGHPTAPLVLSSDERDYLERQVRRHRVARSMSERCRIILRCADGFPSKVVAAKLGIHEHTVGKWRRRFLKDRIEGLLDEARPGRPRTIDDDHVAAVSLPARSCGAASILQPASSKLTSAHSSSATTRTPNLTSGPSPPTRSSQPSSASAKRQNGPYVANFRFRH